MTCVTVLSDTTCVGYLLSQFYSMFVYIKKTCLDFSTIDDVDDCTYFNRYPVCGGLIVTELFYSQFLEQYCMHLHEPDTQPLDILCASRGLTCAPTVKENSNLQFLYFLSVLRRSRPLPLFQLQFHRPFQLRVSNLKKVGLFLAFRDFKALCKRM